MYKQTKSNEKVYRNKPKAARLWSLGAGTSSRSYEIESWNYIRQKDYQLHLMQKTGNEQKVRPQIPTTEFQRLAFIQFYKTSTFKIQVNFLHQYEYSTFFWLYTSTVLLSSLPINYIHIFLAAYNPNEHLFGSKMVPICLGVSWQVVLCALFQLVASADILALFMHYTFTGFFFRDPWNKCAKTWNYVTSTKQLYRCYTISEFYNITKRYQFYGRNRLRSFTRTTGGYLYKFSKNGTMFTISPLNYFIESWVKINVMRHFTIEFVIIFVLIWISAALFYKQLYKKSTWMLVTITQIVKFGNYFCCFIYIYFVYLEKPLLTLQHKDNDIMKLVKQWNMDFYADSISGPPVVHLLNSRRTDEIDPARDSLLMTLTNSAVFFIKGLINYKLKDYVESEVKSTVGMSNLNPYPIFYTWPFFYSNIWGDFVSRVFYTVNMIGELILFLVTYQLLIEVLVWEWKWARRWIATLIITTAGLALSLTLEYRTKLLLYIFTTGITSLTEILVIFWMYPMQRFMDDIHFHKGTPVTTWRKWGFRILPLYYIAKIYASFKALIVETYKCQTLTRNSHITNGNFYATKWAWAVGILPLPLGAIFAIFWHLIVKRENWRTLLKPRREWGPREDVPRQLRKQFDSREYVSSQATRFLSRHLINKAQTASYRLDVRYYDHPTRRRSTTVHDEYTREGDRRNIYREMTPEP